MSKGNKIFEGIDFSGFDTLDELDAASAKQAAAPTNFLPLSSIIEDPDQPRTAFDDDKLEELANSIRERGLIQAITVKPANSDGKHMIVSGARRYRASRLAGKDTILAVIRSEASDSYDQMIENIQREALSHRDTATFIRDQMATGAKKSSIAKSLGKSPAWVTAYADFFNMDPAIQDGMEEYGTRAAYELHAAMQLDEAATRRFLTRDEPITRRSAAAFHHALKSGGNGLSLSSKNDQSAKTAPKSEAKRPSQSASDEPFPGGPEYEAEVTPPPEPEDISLRCTGDGTPSFPDEPSQPPLLTSEDEAEASRSVESRMDDRGSEHSALLMPTTARQYAASPVLVVSVGERVGRLLLDRRAGQGGSFGVVVFDDHSEEEARLSDLVLMEFVEADEKESHDA